MSLVDIIDFSEVLVLLGLYEWEVMIMGVMEYVVFLKVLVKLVLVFDLVVSFSFFNE